MVRRNRPHDPPEERLAGNLSTVRPNLRRIRSWCDGIGRKISRGYGGGQLCSAPGMPDVMVNVAPVEIGDSGDSTEATWR